jgi:predicted RNase H-like HicB family nuclease
MEENMNFKGTMKIEKGEVGYCATCIENKIVSQGKTIEKAIENLKEAITVFYEDGDNADELEYLQKHEVLVSRLDFDMDI